MKFEIDNMTCGGCAKSVTRAIQSIDPQAKVDIDIATRVVRVTSTVGQAAIAARLEDVGYPPRAMF